MKKIISIALIFVIVLSLTSCKGDNEYVKLAKTHRYWHGFGGITWGMTIDDCVTELGLTVVNGAKDALKYGEAVIEEPESLKNDFYKAKTLTTRMEIYERVANVSLTFYDWSPVEEKGEWLGFVELVFDEPSDDVNELFKPIFVEFKTLGLRYEPGKNGASNVKNLASIPQSDALDKTVAQLKEQHDILEKNPQNQDIPATLKKGYEDKRLESFYTHFFNPTDDAVTRSTIYIDGTIAACLAVFEMGRTP